MLKRELLSQSMIYQKKKKNNEDIFKSWFMITSYDLNNKEIHTEQAEIKFMWSLESSSFSNSIEAIDLNTGKYI